ncbi:MAG: ThiF family adenylyltransferase [Rhodospirillales bacterium]|nr:ThiF family adenylyltransferase [Rhodospirillales bacterium]
MLGDHGLWAKLHPLQPSLGVPLIFSGPGIAVQERADPVSLIDLGPTFVAWAGGTMDAGAGGTPLQALLAGGPGDAGAVRFAGFGAWRAVSDGRYKLIAGYDIVCDGTDNFPTRFLVADACVLARRTLVSAAVLRFDGQLSVFKPHAGPDCPCYRCLYPAPPPDGLVPSCGEAGVLGAVTGVMGTLQATEVLKEIMGIGETLAGRVLIWDALAARFRTVRLRRDPGCPACGEAPSIRDLSAHHPAPAPACAV